MQFWWGSLGLAESLVVLLCCLSCRLLLQTSQGQYGATRY